MVFTKLLLENALASGPFNYEAASQPLLPKVAHCIYIGKCATRVLKRHDLYNLIPPEHDLNYNLRMPYDYDQHIDRTTRFSHTYFQNYVSEWNCLDVSMSSSQTISKFKRKLSKLIRPHERSIFNIYDLEGIKLLTHLRVEFSDLRYHRYRHNFHCASPTCLCQTGTEGNEHLLLHCPRFSFCNADLSLNWSPNRLMLI